ncbi:acetoacetate decarboxylase family protein [Variovorax sp.]|uniref:acetoacetate decarboxylase family protein n=1 Tax=Variovorax sp. TaxID=1871043 RepID=UPI003BAB6131
MSSSSAPSFTPPFTSSGRSALVQAPPWHYAGWMVNVAFEFDAARGAALVPAALGTATGKGCVHFADWQSCGNDGRELLDPVYAQYRETIVVLEIAAGQGGGDVRFYCPLIYVDQDISLLRGWLQGWPKKIGSTWLTRSMPLIHPAAAPLSAGSRLGASLSVKERRLVDASVTLSGEKAERRLGFLSAPTVGAVGWPDLTQPGSGATPRYLRADIIDRVESGWMAGSASLRFHEHPVEELALLGPVEATAASAGWTGLTVRGALQA